MMLFVNPIELWLMEKGMGKIEHDVHDRNKEDEL